MHSQSEQLFVADDQTAFVLGNGPSLRGIDLPNLPGATFGMNAAYRYWRSIDWRPTYYSCLDLVVGLSHAQAIGELIEEGRIEKFLLRANLIDALGSVGQQSSVICFEAEAAKSQFLRPPCITTGSHTLLWGVSMGFQKLALLGIDGNYKEIVDGAQRGSGDELTIVREGPNPNYFFEDYQQAGDRYNVPNPRPGVHIEGWEQACGLIDDRHVTVVNGNPSSAVEYFPYIDLEAALGTGSHIAPAKRSTSYATLASGASLKRSPFKSFGDDARTFAVVGVLNVLVPGLLLLTPGPYGVVLALIWLSVMGFLINGLMLRFRRKAIQQFSELSSRLTSLEHFAQRHSADSDHAEDLEAARDGRDPA